MTGHLYLDVGILVVSTFAIGWLVGWVIAVWRGRAR